MSHKYFKDSSLKRFLMEAKEAKVVCRRVSREEVVSDVYFMMPMYKKVGKLG